MPATYVKIFASLYSGSLATRGPWEALITFQQMLVLAEWDGTLDMTPEVLSRTTLIPLEIIKKGIAALLKPDPDSRGKKVEGRRIVPIDPERNWGWRVVNIEKYRKRYGREDRNEYQREYMRERRAKTKKEEAPKVERFSPPDWVPLEQWNAWLEVRKRIKAPNTDRAMKLAVKDLLALRDAGHEPGQILDLATSRGWRGLFPPKGNGQQQPSSDGEITCTSCGKRVRTWTDGRCDPCWKLYMEGDNAKPDAR